MLTTVESGFQPGGFDPVGFQTGESGELAPVSIKHTETLGKEIPSLEFELPTRDADIVHGQSIYLYRDNGLIFQGPVRIIDDGSATKRQTITARHITEKALRRLTKHELYETEPALIVKSLNQPISERIYSAGAFLEEYWSTDTLSEKWEQVTDYSDFDTADWVWDAGGYIKAESGGDSHSILTNYTGSENWTDYTVEAKLKHRKVGPTAYTAYSGLMFRVQDWTHRYTALMFINNTGGATLYLKRCDGGQYQHKINSGITLAQITGLSVTLGSYFTLKVKVTGANIKIYLNDVLKIDHDDSTYLTGKIGVGAVPQGSGGDYHYVDSDDIKVVVNVAGGSWSPTGNPAACVSYAIDRDETTAWTTVDNQTAAHYWKLDLGQIETNVGLIRLKHAAYYPQNFKVEVSTDDSAYDTVLSRTSNTLRDILVPFTRRSVRYIKVSITADDTQPWELNEIEVYRNEARLFTEGTINEYGSALKFRFDYTTIWQAIASVADKIGWDAYVDTLYETLNSVSAKGSDKSATIKFEKPGNMADLKKRSDSTREIDRAWALGQGDWINQLEAHSDVASFPDDYAEDAFTFRDVVDFALLQKAADRMLALYKDPVDGYTADVIDDYATGGWLLGDTVKIIDSYLGVNGTYRAVGIERSWSQNAEDVTIRLGRLPVDLDVELRRIDALVEALNLAAQATAARIAAE